MSSKEIQLRTLTSEIFQINPTVSDSVVKLGSFARVYIALYRLEAVNPTRKESGKRGEFIRKVNLLFETLFEKTLHTRDLAERSRLLSILFSLVYGTACASDTEKDNRCRTALVSLMQEYEEVQEISATDCIKEEAMTGICRCLTDFFSPSPEGDEADGWFLLLKTILAKWAGTLSDDGNWKDVSDNIALERIEIMNRNSFMLLDSSYDEQIRRAYCRYSRDILLRQTTNPTELTNLSVLGLLYEGAMQENVYEADRETAKEIVDRMSEGYGHSSLGSDERLYCLSYRIDRLCEEILEEEVLNE